MGTLINEDTQLPDMDFPLLAIWLAKAAEYKESYNSIYHEKVAEGIVFQDLIGDGLGSDSKLRANSTDRTDPDYHHGEHYDDWGFLVDPLPNSVGLYQSLPSAILNQLDFQAEGGPWETIEIALSTPIILSTHRKFRFFLGMAQYLIVTYMQIRAAEIGANLFRIDNRGRTPNG